jgi:cytochrome c2
MKFLSHPSDIVNGRQLLLDFGHPAHRNINIIAYLAYR